MSDTPRTDAVVAEFTCEDDAMVPPDFARTLERELAEANSRILSLEKLSWYSKHRVVCQQLRDCRDALESVVSKCQNEHEMRGVAFDALARTTPQS